MQSTKKLVKDCQQLSTDYTHKVDNYARRAKWASYQPPSYLDEQTLDLMEADLAQTRHELETKILVLETYLPRD